ncbi:MAG TPA: hypothetical protein VK044_07920 [Virgibacillus sp.]|nr:hypothetical protein [Virgibacillus sp.]
MSMWLIIFLIVLFIIAMALTFYAFGQEERKMKKLEDAGDTVEDELQRSHDYEATSIRTYIPIQLWIYAISIILTIIVMFLYLR